VGCRLRTSASVPRARNHRLRFQVLPHETSVLHALFYAVVTQALLALAGWTGRIYDDVRDTGAWTHHAAAIALYVLVVAVAIPTIAGLLLGWLIKKSERDGELKWWALALGARDARHGWDRAFEQQLKTGAVLVIHPKTPVFSDGGFSSEPAQTSETPASWRTLIGVFGERSWEVGEALEGAAEDVVVLGRL
jgi:hypothetical protein